MNLNGTTGGGEAAQEGGGEYNKLLVYMSFSLATLAECVLAGYLTLATPELRRRRATLFSGCLVLSIGVLAALSLVYVMVLLTLPGFTYRSPQGCRVRVAQRYLSAVSCYTLASLALDRYLAICWPLRYQDLLTKKRCYLVCVACWLLPVALLVLPCITVMRTMCEDSETEKRLLLAYGAAYTLGTLATLVLYLLVALEFRRNTYTCSRSGSTSSNHPNTDAYMREAAVVRRRTAKSALTVLMLYTVLSLPHTLLPVVARVQRNSVPKVVLEIGYLVHRFHLLLFLPMYAGTNVFFLASLSTWGKVTWRRVTCSAITADGEVNRRDNHVTHNTEDDIL